MFPVWTVQLPVDEVVDVVPMGDRFVTAVWSVPMRRSVSVGMRLGHRICAPDLERVLFHSPAIRMVQVAIVKVVNVTIVLYGQMAAVRSVHVTGLRMSALVWHCPSSNE
jgi:hypothetical protein